MPTSKTDETSDEKVNKAWLDVARDLGRTDRDGEVYLLRNEIKRLTSERDDYEAEGRRHIKTIAELRHENERLKALIVQFRKWLDEALLNPQ